MNYGRVRVHDVIDVACRLYNVPRDELLSGRRYGALAKQRQAAMAAARAVTGASTTELGAAFRCHHSTVVHALEAVRCDARLSEDAATIAAKARPGPPECNGLLVPGVHSTLYDRGEQVFVQPVHQLSTGCPPEDPHSASPITSQAADGKVTAMAFPRAGA